MTPRIIILIIIFSTLNICYADYWYCCGKVDNKYPAEIKNVLREADKLYKNKKYAEAEIRFKKVLEIDKDNLVAHIGLAKIYYKKRKIDDAILIYEKVTKIKPKPSWFYYLACLHSEKEDYDKSIFYLKKAISYEKGSKLPLWYSTLAKAYICKGKIINGLREYKNFFISIIYEFYKCYWWFSLLIFIILVIFFRGMAFFLMILFPFIFFRPLYPLKSNFNFLLIIFILVFTFWFISFFVINYRSKEKFKINEVGYILLNTTYVGILLLPTIFSSHPEWYEFHQLFSENFLFTLSFSIHFYLIFLFFFSIEVIISILPPFHKLFYFITNKADFLRMCNGLIVILLSSTLFTLGNFIPIIIAFIITTITILLLIFLFFQYEWIIGEYYFRRKKYDELIRYCIKTLKKKLPYAMQLAVSGHLARAYMKKELYDEAINVLNKILNTTPPPFHEKEVIKLLAEAYEKSGKIEEAKKELAKLKKRRFIIW